MTPAQALSTTIVAIPLAAAAICFAFGGYMLNWVVDDMRNRVPLKFRGEFELGGSVAELVWMPGVPVKTRRRFIFASYCACVIFISLTFVFGLLVLAAGGSTPPRILLFFILLCASTIYTVAFTLAARIRHRDKLR